MTKTSAVFLQWNATDVAWDLTPRLGDLLQQAAKDVRNATPPCGFEGPQRQLRVNWTPGRVALAESLVRQGIGPGQRVGICIDRSIELIVALVGTTLQRRSLCAAWILAIRRID
jgi:non-ribosomal peptide synthetase component F